MRGKHDTEIIKGSWNLKRDLKLSVIEPSLNNEILEEDNNLLFQFGDLNE